MPLLFLMDIAGTVPLVICLMLWMIQKNSFQGKIGLSLLKLSIFFYLVPVQLIYYVLPNSVVEFWKPTVYVEGPVREYYHNEFIVPYHQQYMWFPSWLLPAIGIWGCCILLFIVLQRKKYRKLVKTLDACAVPDKNRKAVYRLSLKNIHSPYSVGFLKNYIVMPEEMGVLDSSKILYEHELCHIKNKDTWYKFLCVAAICLHFYDPFVYILIFMYNELCEYVCDAHVIKNLDLEERKKYAQLLVYFAGNETGTFAPWENNFALSKLNIKRRVTYVMRKEKKVVGEKLFPLFLGILGMVIWTTTIWAYEPPKTTWWNPKEELAEGDFMEFTPEGYESELIEEVDFSKSDIVWQENGKEAEPVYSLDGNADHCIHDYRQGLISYHTRNNTGGCTVTRYEMTKCKKCQNIKSKEIYNSTAYKICPH